MRKSRLETIFARQVDRSSCCGETVSKAMRQDQRPDASSKQFALFNFQFALFNLQYPREQTRAQDAPSGRAALGRNQTHLLQILVVIFLTVAAYGEGLEILVKFLMTFEVSSRDEHG